MKILLLAPHPFFQNRGTPIAVKLLAETLANFGYKVTILTFPEGDDLDHENIKINRIPYLANIKNVQPGLSWKKIVYDIVMFYAFIKQIRKNKFDIIHAVEESAFFALFAKKIYGMSYIYDMDSSLAEQLIEQRPILKVFLPIFRGLESSLIKNSIGVVPVCKALEDIVIRTKADPIVQRLEDVSLIPKNTQKVKLDSRLNGDDKYIIMYIGNLEVYQGIDLLLEGYSQAREIQNDSKVVIIGGSEPDIRKYKKRSEELGIASSTIFLGPKPISDMASYFEKANLLVSPRTKGFNTPMKIYSYLDSGKPVLATDLPTHTQVMDENISFLAKPNKKDFAKAMLHIINNKELSERVSKNAKIRVRDEFSIEAYHRKLQNFYIKIAKIIRKESS